MYYHMVQSFPKGEGVLPKIAHKMAVKLAEHFKDYEVLICTHTDRDHIRSRFIINSVALEIGRKFYIITPEIEPIKQLNDKLCMEYGFEVCKPKPKHKLRLPQIEWTVWIWILISLLPLASDIISLSLVCGIS